MGTQKSRLPVGVVFDRVVRKHGVLGLYRGYGACLCRDIGQTICYYGSAEYLGRAPWMQQTFGSASTFCAGVFTGCFHCSVELPFDTIKSRFQTSAAKTYRSLLQDMFDGGLKSGLKQLFRGYGVWMLRAPIVHGTSFLIVERAQPLMDEMSNGWK